MSSKTDSHIATPKRHRHDGWTPKRQEDFLVGLRGHGCVGKAAEAVGMSRESAYRLRSREGAEGFAEAWDEAQKIGFHTLQDIAIERAINGVRVPVFYQGKVVGERVWYDNKLLMYTLSRTNTRRFGRYVDEQDSEEEALRLEEQGIEEMRAMIAELSTVLEGLRTTRSVDVHGPYWTEEDECVLDGRIAAVSARIKLMEEAIDARIRRVAGLKAPQPDKRRYRGLIRHQRSWLDQGSSP